MKTYFVCIIVACNTAAIKLASDDRYIAAVFFGFAAVAAMIGLSHKFAAEMFFKEAKKIKKAATK